MLRLNVIIASTRPGRVGSTVGTWFYELARHHGNFDVRWVDLVDFNLPVFDEPHHPRQQNYQHEHTKRWAASVDEADAYVFVVPEYNFGPTPALLNALNYVYHEWNYKPAAFVSYGGISGGMRSVEATKPTLTTLKMMPLIEQVAVPLVQEQLEDGTFKAKDIQEQSAIAMLDELKRWADALKPMRG
ncbi:NADPH-dependent FMN reductase [Alloalcanivorax profundimaris]|uniref:NADPH-dependent FMN reductase n=1 Tax=Alloalcanivorax profundimaris TaxID=2735259 RepID=A0ABS0AQN6_9GAMM|nr:NAD(P)H-dependent oxidoreductase [Alloalcanivorax profundimaris]MBF1802227.1 NAD(P)H-dependent oxidoreductase [Alloalcanivorax profundimaris]MBF5056448.1 NADPH-dependent FMN reductase [Alloalcanivorax profundimaris]MCQ6261013.1 NAD(P)H-dependent oxidoreductase [Alcanivorax sp. MM125-6]